MIRNALPAISNEMAVDLQRTSYNMIICEIRDFCTALVCPNGDLVSQNVGSGGAGKSRGGNAGSMHIRNLIEGRWNLHRPKRDGCPAWGLNGGVAGLSGRLLLKQKDEKEFREVNLTRHPVPADTEVIVNQGGGWGNPFERDIELVRWDVIEEYITRETAREDFGVVLSQNLVLDEAVTRSLRAARAG